MSPSEDQIRLLCSPYINNNSSFDKNDSLGVGERVGSDPGRLNADSRVYMHIIDGTANQTLTFLSSRLVKVP